jgi:uncharacterized protein (TIGR01777 family)
VKIVLAGGSGFLGRYLHGRLAAARHEVVVLTRAASSGGDNRSVAWRPDGTANAVWAAALADADVVINLAGANIGDKRWTSSRKAEIRDSRILATRSLVEAVRQANRTPPVFISASAVGFYGDTGDTIVEETHPPGSDFLATVCVAWETEARAAEALDCRVVLARSGLVLGRGGVLPRMMLPFRFFAGGPLGSGRQYMSWIHVDDWASLFMWAIERRDVAGALNVSAPNPVTNAAFASAVGRVLQRPSWLRVPVAALRIAAGEIAETLLTGQRVIPKRALDHGFSFSHPEVTEAISDVTR